MERKLANLPGWKRIIQSRFCGSYLDTPEFKGHITLYCMDAVRAPLVVEYFKQKICIVDAGYAWLKQFPSGEHFTVTAHFDDEARLVLWYIDICLRTGVSQDQIPWMDDLYLDLVVSPTREVELKDADELLAARESGQISAAEFDLAWREADRLVELIGQNQLGLLTLSDVHRRMLLQSGSL
jgi:uncharacterized protein